MFWIVNSRKYCGFRSIIWRVLVMTDCHESLEPFCSGKSTMKKAVAVGDRANSAGFYCIEYSNPVIRRIKLSSLANVYCKRV